MRIVVFAAGSRGDVEPCLRLGGALERAGMEALLAVPDDFVGMAHERGLRAHALGGDVQRIMAGDTARGFMEGSGANPVATVFAMRRMLGPVAEAMAERLLGACRDADAIVALAVFAPFADAVARVRSVPLVLAEPTPLLPTAAFPAPGWPLQRSLGPLANRLSGAAMLTMIWRWYEPFVQAFRRRHGLAPLRGGLRRVLARTPLLGAYSPAVVPRPPDWPATAQVTGYWFADPPGDWRPPPELTAFLERGDPPVAVGFGSMAGRDPDRLAAVVADALAASGRRGVLLTGWGALGAVPPADHLLAVPAAPHAWLFPRVAAVVHHGGAGTTAAGLRAGVPTVVVPFIVDQPFWGRRIADLGVGPPPVPLRRLDPERLAAAVAATGDAAMRRRAAVLGATIRAEDGLGAAVAAVRRALEA